MGKGQAHKIRSEPEIEILERGDIFFFYKPKVEKEEVHGPDDVRRLYLVMRPESGERPVEEKQDPRSGKDGNGSRHEGGRGSQEVNIEKEPLFRFIVLGKKDLPDPSKKSRPHWGFVEMVTKRIEDVKDALHGEEYATSTRGHRHKPPARALGEGIYQILRHRTHSHLIYKLELPPPKEKHEAQESLNIEREGSFLIQIKNPDKHDKHAPSSRFRGHENKRKAIFPAHLQGRFGHLRYSLADPPDFLNYEGCEFLLITDSDDTEEEVGLDLETECEEPDPSCSDLVETFGETAATTPLFEGTWV